MVDNEKPAPDVQIIAEGLLSTAIDEFRKTVMATDQIIGRGAMMQELANQCVILSMGALDYDRERAEKVVAMEIKLAFGHYDRELEQMSKLAVEAGISVPDAVSARIAKIRAQKGEKLDG